MRVFVTGASGFVGRATVPELLAAGHEVVGLARSDDAAATVEAAGATVLRGSIDDVDVVRRGAADADGTIHLAYNHDFSDIPGAAATDRAVVAAVAEAYEGSDRPFVSVSGTVGLAPGRVATEHDTGDANVHPRVATAQSVQALKDRGIRSAVVRLAPSVHDVGDGGFVPELIRVARAQGISGYVGDGENRWPGVHRPDAATLLRLALESAPAGSALHGVGEEGVPTREIAEMIGKHLGVPVQSIAPEAAAEHFGWIGMFFAMDAPASNAITRELLGWEPVGPSLLEDLDQGHYFEA
ncbi:MAG: SDR family oxidoreductase [Solirubrobacteraceae bacterium]|nr:SDR family oxidoreductase [Patulibacter sp.]